MISHSVCQGCTGFPYLAQSIYYYIATADINQAAAYAAIGDVFDETELMYVKKVNVSTSLCMVFLVTIFLHLHR